MSAFVRLCSLEHRRLWRAPTTRITVAALLVLECLALVLGILLADAQRELAERDVAASRARIVALVKGEGEASALELGIFQDTAIARGTNAQAAWVAADLAALPDTAIVRVDEPPVMVPAVAERSPAAAVLGTYDLAWFWALLLPLAAIILGYPLVALDRERGLWAMLTAASGGASRLIAARALALYAVLAAAVLPALPIGLVAAPAVFGVRFQLAPALELIALGASYLAFLTAAVIAASALIERSASALAALLFAYLLFALAIPVLAATLVRLDTPEPDPRARLIGEQAAAEVYSRPQTAVIANELERQPSLAPDHGIDGATSQNRTYLLLAAERFRRFKGARFADTRRATEQADLLEWSRWLSPITIATGALAELASTGPTERLELEASAETFRIALLAFVTERVVKNEGPLPDPATWPIFERAPAPNLGVTLEAIAFLVFLASVLLVIAILGGDRSRVYRERA